MAVASTLPGACGRVWRGSEALREARTCYDHLAGRLGVAIADALTGRDAIRLGDDGGEVTETGAGLFAEWGIVAVPKRGRLFCRPCLDRSERRPHIAGTVGAAIASRCLELGWVERMRDTRAVAITPMGRARFRDVLGPRLE